MSEVKKTMVADPVESLQQKGVVSFTNLHEANLGVSRYGINIVILEAAS